MSDPDQTDLNVPQLTFLRRLVTILTLTMIGGIITLVTLIFLRFQDRPASLTLPNSITLPQGNTPVAFTKGAGWYAVVTSSNQILIYDPNGTLLQTIEGVTPQSSGSFSKHSFKFAPFTVAHTRVFLGDSFARQHPPDAAERLRG